MLSSDKSKLINDDSFCICLFILACSNFIPQYYSALSVFLFTRLIGVIVTIDRLKEHVRSHAIRTRIQTLQRYELKLAKLTGFSNRDAASNVILI